MKKCVHNVLVGAGLGATGGLLAAIAKADVAASVADIAKSSLVAR